MNTETPEVMTLKFVLLGESNVGKTSILLRFINDTFTSDVKTTVGATFLTKTMYVKKQTVELCIWDTAGQEVYRSLTPMYYRNANAAFLVYDITNRLTFDKIESWCDAVRQVNNDILLVLCGNKADEDEIRQISTHDGKELAQKLGIIYIEVSALTGMGVNNIFNNVILEALEIQKGKYKSSPPKAILQENNQSCC